MTTKLIEPRYFTIPLILIQFEIKPLEFDYHQEEGKITQSRGIFSTLYLNILAYGIVDIVLIYIFLYKPFTIEGSLEPGRFMW